jgi:hypothetical protein
MPKSRNTKLFVVMLLASTSALGQQPDSWIGVKVVTKYSYPVKIGDVVMDDDQRHRIYTATRVEGEWLWVKSGSVEGWLPAGQVAQGALRRRLATTNPIESAL